jgi:NAD(P)H-hydrate epimerase
MARLTGRSTEEIQAGREKITRRFARRYGVTLVLKGAGTLVASPRGELWINLTGNPGMATGGTGDVLTGLIAGFQAQGISPLDAARLGVYLHGAAGDRAAGKAGMISLIASDLLREVPAVLQELFPWNSLRMKRLLR